MANSAWPSVAKQLADAKATPGSALAKLIQSNQDFHLLRPEEAQDKIDVPHWLRVHWRKNHPEGVYSRDDPTGGYPRALKSLHAWMLAHPDLKPDPSTNPTALAAPPVAPAPPAAPAAPKARVALGLNLRISGAQTTPRSESDIRINYNSPNHIIAASNAIGPSTQAQFYSGDGGATWKQTSLPPAAGDSFQSDPAVDWTSNGTAWAVAIGIDAAQTNLQLRSFTSADSGATWALDATISGAQTAADKEMMWIDHSPNSPFRDNIYVIWHNNNPVFIVRRTAGSWQAPLQVSGAETTGTGIGGDIKTNSTGDVFAFWPDTGSRKLLVAKSTDGGTTFAAPVTVATTFTSFDIGVPSFNSRRALIYVSGGAYRTAAKDLVYLLWVDLTGAAGCTSRANEPGGNVASNCKSRIWFSRSTDGGATWAPARMINDQASLNDQFSARLAVDENTGTLVAIYNDTVDDLARLKTDIWTQSSSDDGMTWSTAAKVTVAQTDETGGGADLGNQYGDYNGLSGYAGIFLPSWTDRRSGASEEIWTASIKAVAPLTWRWANQGTPAGVGVGRPVGVVTVMDSPTASQRPYAFVQGSDGNLWVNWWG